jgi:hypothetical protein
MKTHEIRSYPKFFEPVSTGLKTFEIRKNDRKFEVGDEIILREFRPCPECEGTGRVQWDAWDSGPCSCGAPYGNYTGKTLRVKVTYITDYAQEDGYVVMSIVKV